MNGHDELISLLGAYALDAVDDDERRAVEEHLDICATCRAEVAQHLEVAAALGTTAAASAPDELWATIQDHIDGAPGAAPGANPFPGVGPAPAEVAAPPAGPATVTALDDRRRRSVRFTAALVAAAVIAFLAVGLVQASRQNADLRNELDTAQGSSIEDLATSAVANPSNRIIELTSDTGEDSATAVVTPSGDGFLVSSTLDPLPADRTYQLWSIGDAGAVSLGVLGSDPGASAFHVQGPVTTLAITAERAGGVPAPENIPLVTSTV